MTSELITFNDLRCHSSSIALGTRIGYWKPTQRGTDETPHISNSKYLSALNNEIKNQDFANFVTFCKLSKKVDPQILSQSFVRFIITFSSSFWESFKSILCNS